jgi:butyrate kinase
MPDAKHRILVINPGSTSTKFAVFAGNVALLTATLRHSESDLEAYRGRPILEQAGFRRELIEGELRRAGIELSTLSAIGGRGGLLRPVTSGTYRVDRTMLDELQEAKRGEHASNLGAVIAHEFATKIGIEAYVVDPVSVDEWPEYVRISGSPLLQRECLSHALNTKAVAKRYATEHKKKYEDLRLIVAHLGSGISISAHAVGRMIDVTNSREEGAFSTERAGTVPSMKLVELCFSGKYTYKEIENLLFREGGIQAYLGTKNLQEVEKRVDEGDHEAVLLYRAMLYQIAKEIGGMATTLEGRVDAILLTGGMTYSPRLTSALNHFIQWIAPVTVFPGEDELEALAEGVLRVLNGDEEAKTLGAASSAAVALG